MSKILLLEDDLSLINGLSFVFKKQGFELSIARTLKEAEGMWKDGKYDLLILDLQKSSAYIKGADYFSDGFGRRNKHHYGVGYWR